MVTVGHSLDPLFRPSSVAVVGASATSGSVGSILMKNLMENPFGGVVYPVNPKRKAIHGVLSYPSLRDIPEAIDLAVIATPAKTVPGLIRDCVELGIKGAIVISAGFSELGEAGKKLEQEIKEAAQGKLRIIGPNCLGVIHPPSNLNASFASSMAQPGKIALLSQSGAICTSILDWAREKHIGFSSFVSVGAMLDVDFADLIDYFGDDPNTHSIILYMESIGDVRSFLSAARNVARTKTVIVVKSGRHEAGAKAAASHTGALAGADAVFDAAFQRAGVLRVVTIPDLFSMAEILATAPPPRGPALALITNAGGPGVMATDSLMIQGGTLAELTPETMDALNECLPPFWSHANPIDLLGDATPKRYRDVVAICSKDPGVDGLLVLLTPQAMTDPLETAKELKVAAQEHPKKPLLACYMGGRDVLAGRRILSQAGIPVFESPEAAISAFLHMVDYRRNQELLYQRPEALPETETINKQEVRDLITNVQKAGRTLLTETEAKNLLAAYGIPVTQTISCPSFEEALVASEKLGYPVVLKLLSEEITHKSDVGGVQLNIKDADGVRKAFETIRNNLKAKHPETRFEGVTVQPMIEKGGFELIVGSIVDPQFGPVVLFGAGGIFVEVFKDRALALPPLNRPLAQRLIDKTQISKALKGVRGQPPVDMDALEGLLIQFSRLLCDVPEISEVDMNPLLASHKQVIAVDARVILAPPDTPPEKLPRLAIHPYPNQYTSTFRVKNGSDIQIRAIRPEDEEALIRFHGTHSEETLRLRFFSVVKTLSRESLIRLCHLDYDRSMALVGVAKTANGDEIRGVSRYYIDPETRSAEFAVVVGDAFQGLGLGYHLMERLIDVAQDNNVKRLVGSVLRDNAGMLRLAHELQFTQHDTDDPTVIKVVRDLS